MLISSISVEIFGPLNILGTDKDRNFIFGRRIQHKKYLPSVSDDKLLPKVRVVRVTDLILKFGTHS